jgi:hypothetical protein
MVRLVPHRYAQRPMMIPGIRGIGINGERASLTLYLRIYAFMTRSRERIDFPSDVIATACRASQKSGRKRPPRCGVFRPASAHHFVRDPAA